MLSGSAQAAANLDIKGLLQRPGVRLVAVEFYATWCKPCMEAVPKWKALHEKYRNSGLRLVVINTQDPEGRCLNPGWNPDEMICDEDGILAEQLGVGNSLPAAFLWSWQGDLLIRNGHVGEVEERVAEFLKSVPRVAVEIKDGKKSGVKRSTLTDRLTETGKLTVVSGRKEKKLLRQIRKDSHKAGYDDALACQLGQEVPPNSLLKVEVYGKKGAKKLAMVLHSASKGCAVASVTVAWNPEQPGISVAEGVDKLLGRLKRPLNLPGMGESASTSNESRSPSAMKKFFKKPGKVPYITAGIGAALAGVGFWQLVAAQEDRNTVAEAAQTRSGITVGMTQIERDSLIASADEKESLGTALTVTGSVLLVGGASWAYLTRDSDTSPEEPASTEIGFAPSTNGLLVFGRF